jgi:hypothetical protein
LEKISEEFPYFQSVRVLSLKYLYNQNNFKYNHSLKVAAAYTTDRSVLFDFITSETFTTVQNGLYDKKVAELLNMTVLESEIITNPNTVENSIIASIKESITTETFEQKLEIGKPLEFSVNEKHSFQEWLQLSSINPIERNTETSKFDTTDKNKKSALIDTFIANNPKIPPVNKDAKPIVFEPTIEEKSYLMTETLAKVYLEQKKYPRAIQAYEILILKYPEKSSFFANRISEIKKIQQNNNS